MPTGPINNNLNFRLIKNRPLTYTELDNNFKNPNQWSEGIAYNTGNLVLSYDYGFTAYDIIAFFMAMQDHTSTQYNKPGTTGAIWWPISVANNADPGPTGYQGFQGDQGFQGSGFQGPTGPQGLQGATGFQGAQGAQGITGFQGLQGTPALITTYNGNPTASGYNVGDVWIDTNTKNVFQWDGSSWQNTGNIGGGAQGAQGFQGDQGIQGHQGFQGLQGVQGPQGFQGLQGFTGSTGFQGPQGVQGAKGDQGPTGFQGVSGPTGSWNTWTSYAGNPTGTVGFDEGDQWLDTTSKDVFQFQAGNWQNIGNIGGGAQGLQGFNGSNGAQGFQGYQGPGIGAQGYQGETGPTGLQGLQGAKGDQGSVGAQGAKGDQGSIGAQGAKGDQGFQGPTGLNGISGTSGVQGFQGPTGFQGAKGDQGSQGPTGFQGTIGLQGAKGDQGSVGSQGPTGYQGFQGDDTAYLAVGSTTVSYTLQATDAGNLVEIDSASNRTVTVPLNSSVTFAIGTQILIVRKGSGEVDIAPAGGVTINSANAYTKLNNQYSSATLIQRATDDWYLFGDLKP